MVVFIPLSKFIFNIMKKGILLVVFICVFIYPGKTQTINCGSFCVSDVSLDTIANTMKVTITSLANSGFVNYPVVVVVNNAGDTISNKAQQYYYFGQTPGTTLVHTLPTIDTTVLSGLPYTIYMKDNIYHSGCIFNYPMTCFVGINEIVSANNSLSVFPNPDANSVTITVGELNHQNAIISIYNDYGQLVKTMNTTTSLTSINTETIPNGIYFITVDINGKRLQDKVMISNR